MHGPPPPTHIRKSDGHHNRGTALMPTGYHAHPFGVTSTWLYPHNKVGEHDLGMPMHLTY